MISPMYLFLLSGVLAMAAAYPYSYYQDYYKQPSYQNYYQYQHFYPNFYENQGFYNNYAGYPVTDRLDLGGIVSSIGHLFGL